MDENLWKKVCDDEDLPRDHWIRQEPRPAGPVACCPYAWCNTTRRYAELLNPTHSAHVQPTGESK